MPVTQDRLTRLREFGLSEYAARSYLALLDLGIAEARDVSSLSKVPQAKIYHVLEQLHEKGLVVILPEFPKKYAPIPFEEYLGRLYAEHTKAAEEIGSQRAELAEMFRVMGDTEVGDRGFFTVIRGRRNVLARIEEMIRETQRELVVLGTAGTASRASQMIAHLREAHRRDVRLRMLAPVEERTLADLVSLASISDLRARELGDEDQSGKVAIVISDAARAFLIHFVPDDGNLYTGKDIGVFTDQEAMVAAIQAIVEPHWARATPYERRRREIEEGRAPEFTHVYATRAEAREALAEAFARGARDVRVLNGFEAAEPGDDLFALRPADATWRAIYNFRSVATLDAYARSMPGAELRHMRTPVVQQQLIIDEREAFFGLGTGTDRESVVVHTNSPAVLRALRMSFDNVWGFAAPIDERRRELEIFPGLQPGDVGIGRLFHLLRDAVIVADERGEIVLWNPAASVIFGRDATEVRGFPLAGLIASDARDAFADRLARFSVKGNEVQNADFFDALATRASGAAFPVEVTLSLLRTAGSRVYVVAIVRDITARKQAQEAELSANQRILRAYDRMTEAFYALDSDFRFVYRNPVVRAMQAARSQRRDEEIDGQNIWTAFPDLAGTKFESELKRAMREKKAVKFEENYPRLGMWFEVNAYPSEEGLSVYYRDITQQKRSTLQISAVLEATPDGILVISRDGRITGFNEKFRTMWRLPREVLAEGVDQAAILAVLPELDDPEGFQRKIRELYSQPTAESRDTITFKDGRVFERFSKPQRVGDEIVGRVWTFRDVTPDATEGRKVAIDR